MKEQYLAEFQTKWSEEKGMWINATKMFSKEFKSYASTKEEALEYLNKAIERGEREAKHGSTQEIGHTGLGISTEPTNGLIVTKARVRVRKVTPWEVDYCYILENE